LAVAWFSQPPKLGANGKQFEVVFQLRQITLCLGFAPLLLGVSANRGEIRPRLLREFVLQR
jgi:hypothetical protein